MRGKKLTAEEIAKCEKLIAKGFKNIEIEEILDKQCISALYIFERLTHRSQSSHHN